MTYAQTRDEEKRLQLAVEDALWNIKNATPDDLPERRRRLKELMRNLSNVRKKIASLLGKEQ